MRRFEGATARERTTIEFPGTQVELHSVALRGDSESELYVNRDVLLGTIDGGSSDVRLGVEGFGCGAGRNCADQQASFRPRGAFASTWPATTLTYVALFFDPATTDALTGVHDRSNLPSLPCADDPFLSAALLRLAEALQRSASSSNVFRND